MTEGTGEIQKPRTNKRRRAGLLLLFVAIVISGSARFVMRPKEPSYEGKPLHEWLTRAGERGLAFDDPVNREVMEFRGAIRAIGTNAIPILLGILRAEDSALKTAVMNLADTQHFFRWRIRSVELEKNQAWIGFYLLGEIATNAVPELIAICERPSSVTSKEIAERTLMRLYPAKCVAVPYWLPVDERPKWYVDVGLQWQSENISNALLAFSQAIELQPTNVIAYCSRGDARLDIKDFTEALEDFQQALELSPTNDTALYGRGLGKFGLKDFRGAETDFTKVLNGNSNDCRVINSRGLARANLRKFPAALEDFNQAIGFSRYESSFYRNRAMVERIQKDYELAIQDASKSIELDSKDPITWALRGGIQTALKNYPEALVDLKKAIEIDPTNSNPYVSRALVHTCKNEFEEADVDLAKAFQLNVANASAFLVRAVLRTKCGQDSFALPDFERAVELAPQAPETHGMLGLFQYRISQWEQALANCRKALEIGSPTGVGDYYGHVWLIQSQTGAEMAANQELEHYLMSLDDDKTNEWSAITARFLTGSVPETNLLNLAITSAKRPSAVTNQICEAFFYAAMKRKVGGDKQGALELLEKCVATKNENDFCYMDAVVEIRALKEQ
jgi:tetratricopeptide (TPR) repeat protein